MNGLIAFMNFALGKHKTKIAISKLIPMPCPNIFAGGHNFHGRFEFLPVQSMEKAMMVIVKIAEKLESRS